MSWDYEHAYPGGKMVAVRGFPRPLYPPDAAPGHVPSVAGPDVEAYKRTISRAGRWEWQPFDQAYSNAFSHGRPGGNVNGTGVAGVQRQQGIPVTGFVGEKTFNTLRSIRVPSGLPHAGEMAMDARSVELVNAAWEHFRGHPEPPQPAAGSSAQARLARAQSQIGVKEDPPNSNETVYCDWYGMVGPWCAMFVSWCDQTGDQPTETFLRGVTYAYVPYILGDARLGKNGLSCTSSPLPGDLVCFDWSWDGEYDHVGIVETPVEESGDFTTVEGNTGYDDNSNGGQVMRRTRNLYGQATVFVRVAEP